MRRRHALPAALRVTDARTGTEQVVIVAETNARATAERDEIERGVVERVTNAIGGPPDVVRLVRAGSVLKTSSGKIRRNDTKRLFLSGSLGRDKRDSGPSHRQYATSAAPRERDRPIDPNSPFAKLAALKEQLAGNRKD